MTDPADSAGRPSGRPPRRKRYRGIHPRVFEERYKELNSERYPGEAAKARARGGTPAGSHVPVLLAEVVDVLRPRPGGIILDCTFGHGGHAEALAERVRPGGRLIALDLDADELARSRDRLIAQGTEVSARHANFAGAAQALAAEGVESVDAVLADLGASSMQIDDPRRGFSYKRDGPLDLRMDPSRGPTAADWLRGVGEEELARRLAECGEPQPERLARAMKIAAGGEGPLGTRTLAAAVLRAKGVKERPRLASPFEPHPAARAFQALRVAVNREDENLKALLRGLPWILRPGGRGAIITFHSAEDSVVEASFAEGLRRGLYAVVGEPLRPRAGEARENPRARSAILRWAERAGGASPQGAKGGGS